MDILGEIQLVEWKCKSLGDDGDDDDDDDDDE